MTTNSMIWNYAKQKFLCFKKPSSTNANMQAWLIETSDCLSSNLKQKGNLKEEREIWFFMWVSVMGWLMLAVLNKPVTQREII